MKIRSLLAVSVLVIGFCGVVKASPVIESYFEYAIEDATVDSVATTANYGDDAVLTIQGYYEDPSPFVTPLNSIKRTYLKFDLSTIPDEAEIVSAEFGIYLTGRNDGGLSFADPRAALYFVAVDTWQQSGPSGITWDNMPSPTPGDFIDDEIAMGDPGYHKWNLLTNNGWSNYAVDLADNKLTLLLITTREEDINNFATYNSSEAVGVEIQPYLSIAYIPEPATIALLGLGGLLLRKKK